MAFGRSGFLSNPAVAAALSLLGGGASAMAEERRNTRRLGQQWSMQSMLQGQEALQKNIDRSMESQLRLTEQQKLRQMQIDNPTPVERAQLESEQAQAAASRASEARYNRLAEEDPDKTFMRAVIKNAYTVGDPEEGLGYLRNYKEDFRGDPEYKSAVDNLGELAKEKKKDTARKEASAALRAIPKDMDASATLTAAEGILDAYGLKLQEHSDLIRPFVLAAGLSVKQRAADRQSEMTRLATEEAEPWFGSATPDSIQAARSRVTLPPDPAFEADSMATARASRLMGGVPGTVAQEATVSPFKELGLGPSPVGSAGPRARRRAAEAIANGEAQDEEEALRLMIQDGIDISL